jgi:hypothetical protein
MHNVFELNDSPVLLSIKLGDNDQDELSQMDKVLSYLVSKKIVYDIFFHTFDNFPIEQAMVKSCRRAFCANSEIYSVVKGLAGEAILSWSPATLNITKVIFESKLNLFSFGMAYKLQVRYYKQLYELLQKSKVDYSIWVSTAFHEKANFGDFNSISKQLVEIFGEKIQFLGFLSDEAVNYFLGKSHLFIAFFPKGIRANNSSVMAAMSEERAILTNCDEFSPHWMTHGINLLDIHQLKTGDFDFDALRKIGIRARKDIEIYASWEKLIENLS